MASGPSLAIMRAMRTFWMCVALVACGGEDPTPPGSNVCGVAGEPTGTECDSQSACGTNNFRAVSGCDHCLWRNETHACESGVCRALPIGMSGNIGFNIGVPAGARGAKSYVMAAVFPIMADGSRVTCAALTSTCMRVNNGLIGVGNSTAVNIRPPADPDLVYPSQSFDYPGEDHLLLLMLTSEERGAGNLMAIGCAEGIDVVNGEVTRVDIPLTAL